MTVHSEVIVFGTINMDLYSKISRMPLEGETLSSEKYFHTPGGKALNQATAAARMGKTVSLIGKIGDDTYGDEIKAYLEKEGIVVDNIISDNEEHTGVSFVLMDRLGNNSIITNLGANKRLAVEEVMKPIKAASHAKVALLQLEMNKLTRGFIIKELHERGIKTILNLAPVVDISPDIRSLVDILIVNRVEAEQLTNQQITDYETAKKAANVLFLEGNETVIITLGADGVLVSEGGESYIIKAPQVKAVDTTGAGDCFCGSLAAFLLENDLKTAVQRAVEVASHSVLKVGTIDSIPYLYQLKI